VIGAIYSSYKDVALKSKPTPGPSLDKEGRKNNLVLIGEVSLLGQVRKVKMMEKRVKEIKSLGKEVPTIYSIKELKELI